MDLLFLILLNAILFIRPAEFIPALLGLPIYQIVLVCCLAVSFHRVLEQLGLQSLVNRPISACVVILWVVVVLSDLSHVRISEAMDSGWMFFKIILYYLLIVGVVNSPDRLRWFLASMIVSDVVVTGVALLDYHGIVNLPNLNPLMPRLGSTGLFGDPNDMCALLVQGMILSVFFLEKPNQIFMLRFRWLGPSLLFGYAFSLTDSRGGFVSLLAALLVYLPTRFRRRAFPLGLIALPFLFVLFAGRQTDLDVSTSTGQTRIHLWDGYLGLFRGNPLLGIGCGNSMDYNSHVAHNAFISAYAELGFIGGMFFVGAFYLALRVLWDYMPSRVRVLDLEMARLYPYLIACVACYVFGMMSLSRQYAIPTYNVLALVVAYQRVTNTDPPLSPRRFTITLVGTFAVFGVIFYLLAHYFVRINANYYG